jgi:glycosyltransferase involved in cell wall biosynthesis
MVTMKRIEDTSSRRGWVINGRFVTQRMTGVQRYAYEIVAALDALLPKNGDAPARTGLRLLVPPAADMSMPLCNIEISRAPFGSGHAFDQFVVPFYGAGVLSLGNLGPVLAHKHIVCIHDANTFILPDSYSRSFGLAYRTLLPWVGRRASRVATVSTFSAEMLVRYGICRSEKIFIAPNGHEHVLRWDPTRAQLSFFDAIRRPYVLLLGSRAKHKNVEVILNQAQALDAAGIDVVVAGPAIGIFAAQTAAETHPNVHHLGFVDDDALAKLYENAMCLVFPSRTEGFGIPPLEAMTLGCPVISSNAASLVEVGGDAVLYVSPDDGDQWREAIIGLHQNQGLRADLSERGRKRSKLFSWKRSAELYLEEMLRLSQAGRGMPVS